MFLALAEFAWLVVFGSVFMFLQTSSALRGVTKDLRENKDKLDKATERAEKFEQEVFSLRSIVTNIDQNLIELNTLRTNNERLLATNKFMSEALAEKERALNEVRSRQAQLQHHVEQLQAANTRLTESNLFLLQRNAELFRTNLDLASRSRELEDLRAANSNLVAGLQATNAQLEETISADVAIRRELTGLPPGALNNVVFVFDTSLSMKNSPAWPESVSLVRMWLEHLPVTECALVMFDDQPRPFPKAGGYQTIRDSEKKLLLESQKKLTNWFAHCPAGNTTDLYSALSHVYTHLSDAKHIIIFTDGKPEAVGGTVKMHRRKVHELVLRHKDIPLTCIGVNDYYTERDAVTFLKTLASETKGTFIGR